MQRAIVVNVGGANNEMLDGGHQRVPAEGLAIMIVDADEPCRPALDTVQLRPMLAWAQSGLDCSTDRRVDILSILQSE